VRHSTMTMPTSETGHQRTSQLVEGMSALPPNADIAERDWHVHFVPKGDKVHRSKNGGCLITSSARLRLSIVRPGDTVTIASDLWCSKTIKQSVTTSAAQIALAAAAVGAPRGMGRIP
jgi:hypothetical protein